MSKKILDVIFFIGGTFISICSLVFGFYYNTGKLRVGASRIGFSDWALIGIVLGICMIVFGFLRRSWNKKEIKK